MTKRMIKVSAVLCMTILPGMLLGVDVTPITSKFLEMAEPVFTVLQYIGIIGGVGGGIAMLLFRLINKDNNIWADALKIVGAGAALASLSKIIEMIATWATYGSQWMKIYKILGTRQPVIDQTQAVLVGVSSMIGVWSENVFFLVIAPALFFAITFIIKLKYFGGKPEWGVCAWRMINSKRIYYSKQHKDRIEVKK